MLGSALLVVAPAWALADQAVPAVGQWWLLAVYAMVPGNGHLLLTWSHQRVTAALSSLILAGVPLLSTVWAHLLFDEPLGWRHLAGMLLVVVAIVRGRAVERSASLARPSRDRPEPAPATR